MPPNSGGSLQGAPARGFLRDPLTVGILTMVAPVLYFYWWLWQFFGVARRERFVHIRSYLAVFIPIFNYVTLYQLFKDLKQRLDGRSGVRFSARTPILILVVGNAISLVSLGAREPYALAFLMVSLAFPALVAYRVQCAVNAYLQQTYPQQIPESTGLGEVAAVVLGVTLLGLDVLGATRGTMRAAPVADNPAPISTLPSLSAMPTPTSSPPHFPASKSTFSFSSDKGDFIGSGETETFDQSNAAFEQFRPLSPGIGIRIDTAQSLSGGAQGWYIVLAAPTGQSLRAGTYENAKLAGFNGDSPGIDVHGEGRDCATITGAFTISRLQMDASANLEVLDASFTEYCNGTNGPAFRGEVHYQH